jgi:hypothetical protein
MSQMQKAKRVMCTQKRMVEHLHQTVELRYVPNDEFEIEKLRAERGYTVAGTMSQLAPLNSFARTAILSEGSITNCDKGDLCTERPKAFSIHDHRSHTPSRHIRLRSSSSD